MASTASMVRPDIGMLERAVTIYTRIGRKIDIGLWLIWNKTSPTIWPVTLQRGSEEFPAMHGVDLHGDAPASVPVSLLANPVHFSRTPIVYDPPPPALGAHTAEVWRQLLDSSAMGLNRLQQNART